MGLRTFEGHERGCEEAKGAILFCSTSMTALPFMFGSGEEADAFVEHFGDIRRWPAERQQQAFDDWKAKLCDVWRANSAAEGT